MIMIRVGIRICRFMLGVILRSGVVMVLVRFVRV